MLKLRGFNMTAADGREYSTVLIGRGEIARAGCARVSARWDLSHREAQILSLVGDSKSGPEIALLLAISHDTVRKHVGAGFGAGSESAREGSADGSAN